MRAPLGAMRTTSASSRDSAAAATLQTHAAHAYIQNFAILSMRCERCAGARCMHTTAAAMQLNSQNLKYDCKHNDTSTTATRSDHNIPCTHQRFPGNPTVPGHDRQRDCQSDSDELANKARTLLAQHSNSIRHTAIVQSNQAHSSGLAERKAANTRGWPTQTMHRLCSNVHHDSQCDISISAVPTLMPVLTFA